MMQIFPWLSIFLNNEVNNVMMSHQGSPAAVEKSTVLIDRPRVVDIASIERELTALWEAASDADRDGVTTVTRACSMNLIVVGDADAGIEEISTMVGEVAIIHPGRIFMIVLHRTSARTGLDAWVSARCSLPTPGRNQVCCEEITIKAHGADTGKVASVVTSLLVSDVPIVVLWKSTINIGDPLMGELFRIADRVLVDTSEQLEPQQVLRDWGRVVVGEWSGTDGLAFGARGRVVAAFGDLSWGHLTPWRTLLARLFDPQETRPVLKSITQMDLSYTATSTPLHSGLGQSLLLVAWLAGRLGWIVDRPLLPGDRNSFRASLRRDQPDGLIEIRLGQVPARPGVPGAIESIDLKAGAGFRLRLRADVEAGTVAVERTLGDGRVEGSVHTFMPSPEAALVAKELDLLHRDALYEGSLHSLLDLLGEGQA